MTDIRTPVNGFGRVLGETSKALDRIHRRILADGGSDFDSWVAYVVLDENAPSMPDTELVAGLTRRLDLDEPDVQTLLGRLVARGDVAVEAGAVRLTDAGTAHFAELRAAVSAASNELLAPVDPAELETTMNVLRAIGERVARSS